MTMIPTPRSRVQSFDTLGTRRTTALSASQQDVNDDGQLPPEADPMPWFSLTILFRRGEENVAAAPQPGRVYLRWDGGSCLSSDHAIQFFVGPVERILLHFNGYEVKVYESWRQRAAKRLWELFHEIRKKELPHGWISEDIFERLVEFWWQENFKKLQQAISGTGPMRPPDPPPIPPPERGWRLSWDEHPRRVRCGAANLFTIRNNLTSASDQVVIH
ncbi:hypothetical protein PIB30_090342 [Stylosanthes scabra]|uniref:Uncharacterized protein n=1 Tax=Stylosanthes scabra TaxID=79078 RepID=A0ABU6SVF6_9FABA|nr:hypothetical protein [Stylosanthes scabra]